MNKPTQAPQKTPQQIAKEMHDEMLKLAHEKHKARLLEKSRKDATVSTWKIVCDCGETLVFKGRRDKACAYFDRQGWMALKDTNGAICGKCLAEKMAEAEAAKAAADQEKSA